VTIAIVVRKGKSFTDSHNRIRRLADRITPAFQVRFLKIVELIKDSATLAAIEELILVGRIDDALVITETTMLQLGRTWQEAFVLAGDETAELIGNSLGVTVNFDALNDGAIKAMQENKLRLVREFGTSQREATREALRAGVARGINPRDMAREFRGSIGLTQRQVQAVNNYRDMLHRLDRNALRRQLRDKRFDRTIDRAIREGKPLTGKQIDTMVERYRARYLKYRSEVIARTEALRVAHAGSDEMYRQAIENGTLQADALIQTWKTSNQKDRRPWHRSMHDQQRPFGEPFLSGLGNLLRYPGDPDAPGSETIQCKCAKTTRYKEI